jgi:hypothetical protein
MNQAEVVVRHLLHSFLNHGLIIPLGPFRICSKIRGDIRSSRFATGAVSLTPVADGKNLQSEKCFFIFFGHLWVVELA